MNRKLARLVAVITAAAAIPAAAIVTAGSASAATMTPAAANHGAVTTSSTAGIWYPFQMFTGTGVGIWDYNNCEIALAGYQKQYPSLQWACVGPYYDPPLATASNHYDPYYAELYLFIP